MTADETAKVLGLLKAVWTEQEIGPAQTTIYHEMLGDLPLVSVMGAAKWHIAEEKWFPKPSELRNKAITLLDGIVPFYSYPGLGNTGLQRQVRLAVNAYGHAQLEG